MFSCAPGGAPPITEVDLQLLGEESFDATAFLDAVAKRELGVPRVRDTYQSGTVSRAHIEFVLRFPSFPTATQRFGSATRGSYRSAAAVRSALAKAHQTVLRTSRARMISFAMSPRR